MNESRIWTFLLLLIVSIGIVLCGFNAATYNKIANENINIGDVTPAGARTLMAFNIIILFFICLLWLYYVYKLICGSKSKSIVDLSKGAINWMYGTRGMPGPYGPMPKYSEIEMASISPVDRAIERSGIAEFDE